jgi:hypothetical protein
MCVDDFEEKLDKRLEQRMSRRQTEWWFLTGTAPNKAGQMKGFLLGPYMDYDTANGVIERKRLVGHAEPVLLPTSDLSKAGQIIRARRLHGNASFADIFQRNQHKNVGEADTI